jgi:regulator of protease activity HflC (stomatin/prohibitin superfamily)
VAVVSVLGAGAFLVNRMGRPFPQVPPGHVAILIRKTGRKPPEGAVIVPRVKPGEEPYQGVQEDVLLPGWYPTGYNALDWDWCLVPQTVVPPGHVGVRVRNFGELLPDGQVFADESPEDEARGVVRRGPLLRALAPGVYPVNSWAYTIRVLPNQTIDAGQVGIVSRRYGPIAADAAALVSPEGSRGVQPKWLPPGTYYANPLAEEIRPFNCQSRRLDLGAVGRTKFPSSDGFDITVAGTVEWRLQESQAPLAYVKYGNGAAVEQRLLLPAARTKSRMQGSRKPAREFISGLTRQSFQEDFERELRTVVESEGVRLQSVLISGIIPPDAISMPIRDRETALLQRFEYRQQIETERTRIDLERQVELEKRPALLAAGRAKTIESEALGTREREVQRIQSQRDLDVARREREAAQLQADALRLTSAADADAVRVKSAAQSEALRRRVGAHGGGAAYARAALLERLAPRFTTIVSGLDGPFAGLFEEFLAAPAEPAGARVSQGGAR